MPISEERRKIMTREAIYFVVRLDIQLNLLPRKRADPVRVS